LAKFAKKKIAGRRGYIPNFYGTGTRDSMCLFVHQRWAESEKLTPKPDPKPKTPNPVSLQTLDSESGSAMLLHTFYIHIPFIPNLVFLKNSNPDPKYVAGLRIRLHAHLCCAHPNLILHHINFIKACTS